MLPAVPINNGRTLFFRCRRLAAILAVCLIALYIFASPQMAAAKPSPAEAEQIAGKGAAANKEYVSIDFKEVDIGVFIKFISELTGRNFIIDPRVRGEVTITSPSGISKEAAYAVFESVLRMHGYAAVAAGRVTKIIPAPYARTMNIETWFEKADSAPGDRPVTRVIRLDYADPNRIRQLFAPLVSRYSVVLAYEPTNMLIITDIHSNIRRLLRIVKEIDTPNAGREIRTIPLVHADAGAMVDMVHAVFNTDPRRRRRRFDT